MILFHAHINNKKKNDAFKEHRNLARSGNCICQLILKGKNILTKMKSIVSTDGSEEEKKNIMNILNKIHTLMIYWNENIVVE